MPLDGPMLQLPQGQVEVDCLDLTGLEGHPLEGHELPHRALDVGRTFGRRIEVNLRPGCVKSIQSLALKPIRRADGNHSRHPGETNPRPAQYLQELSDERNGCRALIGREAIRYRASPRIDEEFFNGTDEADGPDGI